MRKEVYLVRENRYFVKFLNLVAKKNAWQDTFKKKHVALKVMLQVFI